MIEAAIGMALIYLFFSGIVSGIQELLAAAFDRRGRVLEEGVERLLGGVGREGGIYDDGIFFYAPKANGFPGLFEAFNGNTGPSIGTADSGTGAGNPPYTDTGMFGINIHRRTTTGHRAKAARHCIRVNWTNSSHPPSRRAAGCSRMSGGIGLWPMSSSTRRLIDRSMAPGRRSRSQHGPDRR